MFVRGETETNEMTHLDLCIKLALYCTTCREADEIHKSKHRKQRCGKTRMYLYTLIHIYICIYIHYIINMYSLRYLYNIRINMEVSENCTLNEIITMLKKVR